jgi:hypothetical protein
MAESQPAPEGEPTIEEARRMMRGGLAEALQQTAANYVMPICWITTEGGRPRIVDNGSAFLLDCGTGPFLVTAGHVYEAFCNELGTQQDAVCLLSDMRFDPISRCIAHDAAYDVATFRVTAEEIQTLRGNGKHVLTGSQTAWPPQPPTVGRGAFFVGFPGGGRSIRPFRRRNLVEMDWHGYTTLAVADGVSATDITLVLRHDAAYDIYSRPEPPPSSAMGGCSGAPLLTFVEQRSVFSWRLGGIIYESESMIVKAARADCLNADGTINAYPDPMEYVRQEQKRRGREQARRMDS